MAAIISSSFTYSPLSFLGLQSCVHWLFLCVFHSLLRTYHYICTPWFSMDAFYSFVFYFTILFLPSSVFCEEDRFLHLFTFYFYSFYLIPFYLFWFSGEILHIFTIFFTILVTGQSAYLRTPIIRSSHLPMSIAYFFLLVLFFGSLVVVVECQG